MIKQYFQNYTANDENLIMDSLFDHSHIDDLEINLLKNMLFAVNKVSTKDLESYQNKISKIHLESKRIFEKIAVKIIKSDFPHQKHIDLLELHQKIDNTSRYVAKNAQHILIYARIQQIIPESVFIPLKDLTHLICSMHYHFNLALHAYLENPTKTLAYIHEIIESEHKVSVNHLHILQRIYELANESKLPVGSIRCLEIILTCFEDISLNILDCAVGIECLLFNH